MALALEQLTWLADSLRNQGLAVASPPSAAIDGLQWSRGLTHKFVKLRYEPRSIAVSPDGRNVAVGTKAGCIHTLTYTEATQAWTAREYPHVGFPVDALGDERLFALRSLCFLGNRWLLTGFGLGRFRVLDLLARANAEAVVVDAAEPGQADQFLDQVRMLVPLEHDYEQNDIEQLVALGITPGFEPHFLYVKGSKGETRRKATSSHFPEFGAKRLVGAAWSSELLWLLDEAGYLYAYKLGSRHGARSFTPALASIRVKIKMPSGGARFSSLSGSDHGLVIQAGEAVTLVRPDAILEIAAHKAAGFAKEERTLPPDWLHSPGVTDVAVLRPFADPNSIPTRENPIWMYMASSVGGLLWVPWFSPPSPAAASSLAPLGVSSRAPFRSLAATGPREVLQVAAGTLRGSQPPSPCYLAFATREEQLGLISFIEMESTSERLARELPSTLKAESEAAKHEPTNALKQEIAAIKSAGVTLWLARRCLYAHFGLDVRHTLRPRVFEVDAANPSLPAFDQAELALLDWTDAGPAKPWLSRLEPEDVDELARDLVRILRYLRRSPVDAARAESVFTCFRRWVFLMLHRATQIESSAHPALARDLAMRLCSGIERYPIDGLNRMLILGAALRKWITFGDSFGIKSGALDQHAEWDWQGRRSIDAAVYASRLLNDRVDLIARSALPSPQPTNPVIWSLIVASSGAFSLQSHTDGRITACTQHGTTIRWTAESEAALAPIGIDADGCAIQRNDSAEFRNELWYGPFSRALSLVELGNQRFLLVFGTRGWPGTTHQHRRPSTHALLFHALDITSQEPGVPCFVLEQAAHLAEAETEELFSLELVAQADDHVELLGGTRWGGQTVNNRPFLPLRVSGFEHGQGLRIETLLPRARPSSLPKRSVPAAAVSEHNPVRTLACHHDAAGRAWVFAGQDDGRVRLHVRAPDTEWIECEHFGPLSLTSSVRVLSVASLPSQDAGELVLLAFGTADGTIGLTAVDLAALSKRAAASSADSFSLSGASDARNASAPPALDPAVLLVHTREAAEICGLIFYADESDSSAEGRRAPRLMALTRAGVVCVHDVDLFSARSEHEPRQPLLPMPKGVPSRRSIAGFRLDHFNLGLDCRALRLGSGVSPQALPRIVVGTANGQVHFYDLAAPKTTLRRHQLAQRCWSEAQNFKDPVLREVIGPALLPQWLRLAQVGSLHLVRYSLWVELRRETSEISAALDNPTLDLCGAVDAYIDLVDGLADEVFRRRPFSKEPVKIIWEEGAKVTNSIAMHALAGGRGDAELLPLFTKLGARLSQLCNQWVGYEQRLESRVLIHSFNALMDWPSIVLLSLNIEGKDVAFANARCFIAEELIHRRLFFDDLLVPLEALNAINTALVRAIDLRGRGLPACQPKQFDFSFFELIALVGTLAERHETQLGAQHPLRSEITRFFALALLWIPDGVFALAATISECGMTERHREIGNSVSKQAKQLLLQLEGELGLKLRHGERERLHCYELYLRGKDLPQTTGYAVIPDWRSDALVIPLANGIRQSAEALREIFQPAASAEQTLSESLALPDPEHDCLAHSRACLRILRAHREELRKLLQAARETFDTDEVPKAHQAAEHICDAAEAHLNAPGVVFEPQRNQYLHVVRAWRERIQREKEDPHRILDLFDRFNRHVYQATADDLMASLQELAMRTAPLSFLDTEGQPGSTATSLRWLIQRNLGPHPLLSEVFDRGVRLVENAHLSGTLLAVARAMASGASPEAMRDSGTVSVRQLDERLEQLCRSNGLEPGSGLRPRYETTNANGVRCEATIPGGMDVWDAVLQEWTRNVRKYGSSEPRTLNAELSATKLVMYGNRGFRDSLRGPLRHTPAIDLINDIKRKVGVRYAPSNEPGGGFGLPLVLWLCKISGLAADLSLGPNFDPDHPLVLEISWHGGSHDA